MKGKGLWLALVTALVVMVSLGALKTQAQAESQTNQTGQTSQTSQTAADLPDVGAPPVDSGIVTGIAQTAVAALSGKFGWFTKFMSVFLMAVGVLRVAFKPVMLVVEAVIHATPSTADDAALDAFEKGPIYRWIVWVIDWLTSIKLTSAKPATNPLVK